MPIAPETAHEKPDPVQPGEAAQDIPTELEHLVWERMRQLQIEIDALRRENAELKRAEAALRRANTDLDKQVNERTTELDLANNRFQVEIKEREHAEAVLRESEKRYRALATASSEFLYRMSPNWSEMRQIANQGFLADTEQSNPTWMQDYIPLEDQPHVTAAINEAIRTRSVFEMEHRVLQANGGIGWAHSRVIPMLDANGEIVEWFGAASNITGHKQAEAKLKAAVEKEYLRATELDATLASIASGVIIYDNSGVIVRVNEAVRNMIERISVSLDPIHFEKRQAVFGVKRPDGTPLPLEATPYYRALRGETVKGEEVMVTRLNREPLWVDTSAAPIRDGSGAIVGVIAILTDVTEHRQAEEALVRHAQDLTRLQGELEISNREANLYLDILTHDIRNTENVSNLYAELLADTLEGEAAGQLEKLQRSIKKSIEILGTVSTIRRIHQTSSGLTSVDLNAVIQGVIENYPVDIFCYSGARHQVHADDLLSVLFNNLIGNAIKHGGSGVEITIRVEEQNNEVLISVEDTGPGVPDDGKDEIFHRYEQHKRGVGEGLGLYLVQILVKRYGGKIWVDDRVPGRPECGAAFRFTLKKVS